MAALDAVVEGQLEIESEVEVGDNGETGPSS